MSYANKKERIFKYGEPLDIPHSRSESRMKKYWSATDRRAWCDTVELRRQHILELNARSKGQFCLENFIPLDVLFGIMAANKDDEIAKLQERIDYLEALINVYRQIDLTPDQQRQLDDLNAQLAKERKKLADAQKEREDLDGSKEPGRRKKGKRRRRPKDDQRRSSSEESARPQAERKKRTGSEPGEGDTRKPPAKDDDKSARTPRDADKDGRGGRGELESPERGRRKSGEPAPLGKDQRAPSADERRGQSPAGAKRKGDKGDVGGTGEDTEAQKGAEKPRKADARTADVSPVTKDKAKKEPGAADKGKAPPRAGERPPKGAPAATKEKGDKGGTDIGDEGRVPPRAGEKDKGRADAGEKPRKEATPAGKEKGDKGGIDFGAEGRVPPRAGEKDKGRADVGEKPRKEATPAGKEKGDKGGIDIGAEGRVPPRAGEKDKGRADVGEKPRKEATPAGKEKGDKGGTDFGAEGRVPPRAGLKDKGRADEKPRKEATPPGKEKGDKGGIDVGDKGLGAALGEPLGRGRGRAAASKERPGKPEKPRGTDGERKDDKGAAPRDRAGKEEGEVDKKDKDKDRGVAGRPGDRAGTGRGRPGEPDDFEEAARGGIKRPVSPAKGKDARGKPGDVGDKGKDKGQVVAGKPGDKDRPGEEAERDDKGRPVSPPPSRGKPGDIGDKGKGKDGGLAGKPGDRVGAGRARSGEPAESDETLPDGKKRPLSPAPTKGKDTRAKPGDKDKDSGLAGGPGDRAGAGRGRPDESEGARPDGKKRRGSSAADVGDKGKGRDKGGAESPEDKRRGRPGESDREDAVPRGKRGVSPAAAKGKDDDIGDKERGKGQASRPTTPKGKISTKGEAPEAGAAADKPTPSGADKEKVGKRGDDKDRRSPLDETKGGDKQRPDASAEMTRPERERRDIGPSKDRQAEEAHEIGDKTKRPEGAKGRGKGGPDSAADRRGKGRPGSPPEEKVSGSEGAKARGGPSAPDSAADRKGKGGLGSPDDDGKGRDGIGDKKRDKAPDSPPASKGKDAAAASKRRPSKVGKELGAESAKSLRSDTESVCSAHASLRRLQDADKMAKGKVKGDRVRPGGAAAKPGALDEAKKGDERAGPTRPISPDEKRIRKDGESPERGTDSTGKDKEKAKAGPGETGEDDKDGKPVSGEAAKEEGRGKGRARPGAVGEAGPPGGESKEAAKKVPQDKPETGIAGRDKEPKGGGLVTKDVDRGITDKDEAARAADKGDRPAGVEGKGVKPGLDEKKVGAEDRDKGKAKRITATEKPDAVAGKPGEEREEDRKPKAGVSDKKDRDKDKAAGEKASEPSAKGAEKQRPDDEVVQIKPSERLKRVTITEDKGKETPPDEKRKDAKTAKEMPDKKKSGEGEKGEADKLGGKSSKDDKLVIPSKVQEEPSKSFRPQQADATADRAEADKKDKLAAKEGKPEGAGEKEKAGKEGKIDKIGEQQPFEATFSKKHVTNTESGLYKGERGVAKPREEKAGERPVKKPGEAQEEEAKPTGKGPPQAATVVDVTRKDTKTKEDKRTKGPGKPSAVEELLEDLAEETDQQLAEEERASGRPVRGKVPSQVAGEAADDKYKGVPGKPARGRAPSQARGEFEPAADDEDKGVPAKGEIEKEPSKVLDKKKGIPEEVVPSEELKKKEVILRKEADVTGVPEKDELKKKPSKVLDSDKAKDKHGKEITPDDGTPALSPEGLKAKRELEKKEKKREEGLPGATDRDEEKKGVPAKKPVEKPSKTPEKGEPAEVAGRPSECGSVCMDIAEEMERKSKSLEGLKEDAEKGTPGAIKGANKGAEGPSDVAEKGEATAGVPGAKEPTKGGKPVDEYGKPIAPEKPEVAKGGDKKAAEAIPGAVDRFRPEDVARPSRVAEDEKRRPPRREEVPTTAADAKDMKPEMGKKLEDDEKELAKQKEYREEVPEGVGGPGGIARPTGEVDTKPTKVPEQEKERPSERVGALPGKIAEEKEPAKDEYGKPIEKPVPTDKYGKPIAAAKPEDRKLLEDYEKAEALREAKKDKEEIVGRPGEVARLREMFSKPGEIEPLVREKAPATGLPEEVPTGKPEEYGRPVSKPLEEDKRGVPDEYLKKDKPTAAVPSVKEEDTGLPDDLRDKAKRPPSKDDGRETPIPEEYPGKIKPAPVEPSDKARATLREPSIKSEDLEKPTEPGVVSKFPGEPSRISEELGGPSDVADRREIPTSVGGIKEPLPTGPPLEYLRDEYGRPIAISEPEKGKVPVPEQFPEEYGGISGLGEPSEYRKVPPAAGISKISVPSVCSAVCSKKSGTEPEEDKGAIRGPPKEREKYEETEPISEYGTPRLSFFDEKPMAVTEPEIREPITEGYPKETEEKPSETPEYLERPPLGQEAIRTSAGPPKDYLRDELEEPKSEYGTPQHSDEDEIPMAVTEPGVGAPLKKDKIPVTDEYSKEDKDVPQAPSKGDESLGAPSERTELPTVLPAEQEELLKIAELPKLGVPSTCSAVCAGKKGTEAEDDRGTIKERKGDEEQLAYVEYPTSADEKHVGEPSVEKEIGPSEAKLRGAPVTEDEEPKQELDDSGRPETGTIAEKIALEEPVIELEKEPSRPELEDVGAPFRPLEPKTFVTAEQPLEEESDEFKLVAPSSGEKLPSAEPDVAAPDTEKKRARKRSKKLEKGKEKIKAFFGRRKKDVASAPELVASTESFSEGSEEYESAEEEATESQIFVPEAIAGEATALKKHKDAPEGAPCRGVCFHPQVDQPLPEIALNADLNEDEKPVQRKASVLDEDGSKPSGTSAEMIKGPSEEDVQVKVDGEQEVYPKREQYLEAAETEEIPGNIHQREKKIQQDYTTPQIESTKSETPLDIFSVGTHDDTFLSARSRDEAIETRRTDHKCMAPCRNARERPAIFREETGGVILGTDADTPHDLVPPGYYLPEDVSPRRSVPEWADLPATAPIPTEGLSLSDSDAVDNLVWIVPKPEEEILQAPEGDDVPETWETETEEKLEIPESLRTGNVMARVLSGQLVGIRPAGLLIDRSSPQTLPEAIYQQKLSKTCKAVCASNEVGRDEVDDEVEETVEDVSDIHTDSEMPDDVYKAEDILEDVFESATNEQFDDGVLEVNLPITEKEAEEVFADTVEERETARGSDEAKDSYADAKETETSTDELQSAKSSEVIRVVSEPTDVHGILISQGEKPKRHLSVSLEDPSLESTQISLAADDKYEESVAEINESVIGEETVDEEPTALGKVDSKQLVSETVEQHRSSTEEEYTDALKSPTNLGSIDEIQQTEDAEQVTVADKYTEAIQKMPVAKTDAPPRFASWFAPKQEPPKRKTSESSTQFEQPDIRSAETSTSDKFESVCQPTCRKTAGTSPTKPCPFKCGSLSGPKPCSMQKVASTSDIPVADGAKSVCKAPCRKSPQISTAKSSSIEKLTKTPSIQTTGINANTSTTGIRKSVCRKSSKGSAPTKPCPYKCGAAPLKGKSVCKATCRKQPESSTSKPCGDRNRADQALPTEDPMDNRPVSPPEKTTSTTEISSMELEESLRRLAEPPRRPCRAACAALPLSKDDEIDALREEIKAKDAYCAEQRKIATAALEQLENIKNIVEERDDLRKKLENSQFELAELKKNLELGFGDAEVAEKKSDVYVPFKDSDSASTKSCDEEIKVMEDEIKKMRTVPLSPQQETKVIKKEVEVLKRYCSKLSLIQDENSRLKKSNEELKLKCLESEGKLQMLGFDGDQNTFSDIKTRLSTLNETVAERDVLQNRVRSLERELNAYQDLPADVEVFKRRSVLLDDVLKDRDRLAKRVEQMRGVDEELVFLKQKADRVDELERQLRLATKDVQTAEDEMDSMRNKCAMAEIEMLNQKTEADTLRSRVVCMEHEMASLKSMCKEQELLQIEKDRLQVSLDELVRMQDDYEHMCVQMKGLDVVKAERDLYKRKYEDLIGLESECNMLRDQLDKAKIVEREKESLERQTEDLEKCICEQEDEIRRLVTHIDCLAKGREEQQSKMKEVVSGLKIELEKKESLLIESEERMATMHGKIDTSFHSLSEETEILRGEKKVLEQENEKLLEENRILKNLLGNNTEEIKGLQMQLEDKEGAIKAMQNSLFINESGACQKLQAKLKVVINENNSLKEELTSLLTQLDDKDRVIETMQEVLDDRETNDVPIARLQIELEAAKLENQQLQLLAAPPSSNNSPETNYQLKSTLEQSKHAIERIALELGQQYAEWDTKKRYRCCPGCRCKQKGREPEPKVVIRCCAGCTCKKKSRPPGNKSCPCQDAAQQYPCACCKCSNARETGTDPKPAECNSKCVGTKIEKASKTTGDTTWKKIALPSDSEDDGDEDPMFTARSAEDNKARIAELESELFKANDTILQLKERLAASDRLTAENSALRKHSTEVQEVAKDQIEDLVDRLKNAKGRIEELEAANQLMMKELDKERRGDILQELERAKDAINELEAKNCQLKFELAAVKQQLKDHPVPGIEAREDEKYSADTGLLTKIQSELEECLREREKLLNFIENLKQQLTSSKEGADLPDLAAYAQLKTDLALCLKEKEKLLAEIEKLKEALKEYTEKTDDELLAKLQADLESCLKEKEALLKMINNLQNQLGPEVPDMEAFARLKMELDNCSKEKELLKKALEDLHAGIASELKSTLDNCLAEKDNLLKTINELQNQLNVGRTDALPDMAAYAQIKAELENCLKDKEGLTKALEELRKQLSTDKSKESPDTAAFANLKAEYDSGLKEREQLRKALENLQSQLTSDKPQSLPDMAEHASLKAQLEECLREKDNLMKTIQDPQRQPAAADLKTQLENCLKEKQELLKKLSELTQQVESANADLGKALKENEALTRLNDDLKGGVDKLKKEKADLDNMLMSNVATTSRRSLKLEKDLETALDEKDKLSKENKVLENKNNELQAQTAALRSENGQLKAELESLRNENDLLKKQLENQKQEMNKLVDKLKRPSASLVEKSEIDKKDKDAMQATINNLEDQLRSLMAKEKLKPIEPSDDFKGKMNELLRQLEEARKRADIAEEGVRKLKASDPTAMMNAEMQKLKERIAQLEKENASLKHALSQAMGDKDALKKNLDEALKDVKKLKDENNNFQKIADTLKAEKDNLHKDASDGSTLKAENANLKQKTAQMEDEIAALKKKLDQAYGDTKKASDLTTENGDLKRKLAQLEGENSKLKKDLEAAMQDAKRAADRLLELEKDNVKCKQTVKDLEAEVAKLKKELDNQLNDAKRAVDNVSHLQKEIAELKQKIAQLESIRAKMDDENNRVKKELEQARGGSQAVAGLQDENNKMRQQNAGLQSEIDKLKQELSDAKTKLAATAQLQDDASGLRKKLQQLETENGDLKKTLADDTKVADLRNNYDKLRQKLEDVENDNTKLKKDLQKALDDAKKAGDELNDLRQNEKKCKDKIAQLESDNDKLKKSLNAALDDLKKMGTEVTGIQGDESKLKQKVALLETENSKLKKDLDNSLDNAKRAADEANWLKEENAKLKQRVAQLESENAKLKRDVDSALNDLKKLNDQMKKVQDDNAKHQQKARQIEDDAEKLKQKLDAATKDVRLTDDKSKLFEDELARLKKELDAAKKEAKDSTQQHSATKDDNNQLLQKLKQLEADNSKLKKELDAAKGAEAELSKLRSNEDKLKGQLALLEDNNNKLQKEKAALADDVQKAGSDLAKLSQLKDNENKLKQRIAQLEAENAKLKKDLDAALLDAKRFNEELTNEKNDKAKLKQLMSKLESDNQKLKNNLDSATAEAKKGALGVTDLREVDDKLKQRISQLEAENVKLKADLDKALDNAKKTLADLSKLQDDDSKLKQKMAQLEADNSKLTKDLTRAQSEAQTGLDGATDSRSEIAKLKQQVGQLESEIDKLRKQLDAALNDAGKKAAEILKFPDEISNLKKKIAQLEKENERLKKDLEPALANQKTEADKAKKLLDDNNKQKQELGRLENEINKLKKELEAAKAAAADEADRKRAQQTENENLQLKKDLDKALRDAAQLAAAKDDNAKMQQKLHKLQTDLDRLKTDLETAKSEAKKSAADLAKIKDSEAQLKQKVAKLETENVKLKKDLDDAKAAAAELTSLKAKNNKLKDQIKQLQDEIGRLKSAAATKPAPADDTEHLKDELSKLKQKLAALQAENAEIKEQYDRTTEANKETDKLKAANKNLQTQLDDMKKQLQLTTKKLTDENEKLKKKIDSLEQELAKSRKELDEAAKAKDEMAKLKAETDRLQKEAKAGKDATNDALQKLAKTEGKDYGSQIRILEAELEKQKKECQDTIASLKSQFDRDMKNLIAKNGENIDKLQKAHADYIQDLNEKHGKEVKDLRNAIEKLRQELEAAARERDRLRTLLDDQKRKSIDIKGKVEEVEKVISKERRRSKDLEKKHGELQSIASSLEQEIVKERQKSIILEQEKSELENRLRESVEKEPTEKLTEEKASLAKEKDAIDDKGGRPAKELKKAAEDERKKGKDLKPDVTAVKEQLKKKELPVSEEAQVQAQIPKERKKKDDKLTMATFETVSVLPTVLAISPPLSDNELTFYGKRPCPCARSLEELLRKAALKGFGALSIDELQFVHKQLSEAAANILERMGQKTGVLPPTEVGDRLSLLRRIAQLEGDLLKKQKQAQQKISQMQNAVKLEKDRLTELRKTLEREKSGTGAPLEGPRKRISRDVEALEAMKTQLEKRLNQELLNKMKLTQKLSRPERRRDELPVRDSPALYTARDASSPNRNPFPRGHHSTGKL